MSFWDSFILHSQKEERVLLNDIIEEPFLDGLRVQVL